MKLKFICRKTKVHIDGIVPIDLSICINSKRKILATGRKTLLSKFDTKTEKVKNDDETNQYLSALKSRFYAIETELLNKGISITIDTIMDVYKNGTKDTAITILQLFDQQIDYLKTKVERNLITNTTVQKYIVNKHYLEKFIKTKHQTDDILVCNVTPYFVESYYVFLLMFMTNNTAIQKMKQLKAILRFAMEEGYIKTFPFKLKLKKDKIEETPLTLQEVNVIKNTVINNPRLDKVRDLFLFESFTGLAYTDLMSLCKEDFYTDENGNQWIIKKRHKTDVVSTIPLLPIAKDILLKYFFKLPHLSNVKYNKYLKEVGEICGINKKLHSHLARHTFATALLNAGMDMVLVSKCMGHANSKITESTYAKVLPTSIMEGMKTVSEKLKLEDTKD